MSLGRCQVRDVTEGATTGIVDPAAIRKKGILAVELLQALLFGIDVSDKFCYQTDGLTKHGRDDVGWVDGSWVRNATGIASGDCRREHS